MENKNYTKVIKFVYKKRWKYKKEITSESTLEKDLGITGDDGEDFMFDFFNEFNIDYDKFNPNRYFHREGHDTIFSIIFSFLVRNKSTPKYDIKISDLEKALQEKKWTIT